MKRTLSVALVATTVLIAGNASAATYKGSTDVSCDAKTEKSLATVAVRGGSLEIKQTSASNNSTSIFWATSEFGNSLSKKIAGNAKWTGVRSAKYTGKAIRSEGANCNGRWPGNGNYRLDYQIIY